MTHVNNTEYHKIDECDLRAEKLLRAHQQTIYVRTDRLFGCLLVLQFIGGVITALIVSPHTWAGTAISPHIHVWTAFVVGGALTLLPLSFVLRHPGATITRHVIGICQMLMSALLIHLSGGRIETHFHVFGSLAFLAVYRDWRVLISATVVVAVDHLLRGFFWPQSVFGVLVDSPLRSLEHSAWVIFEDVFLIIAIVQSVREMKQIAMHRAQLETAHAFVESEVLQRTLELEELNRNLQVEVEERQRAEMEATSRQQRLKSIVDSASEGIVTIDPQGVIESLNTAAARMFGYEEEELLGHDIAEIIQPNGEGQGRDIFAAGTHTKASSRSTFTKEAEGKRRDSTIIPIELSVSEVILLEMKVSIAIIRDLSEQKQLQCELAQAQKLESVGQLAAGIAHEINTPIQYVGDNTRFLKDAFGDIENALDTCARFLATDDAASSGDAMRSECAAALCEADIEYLREEIPVAIEQSLVGVERVANIVRAMKDFSHPGTAGKSDIDLRNAIETTLTVARNEWKYVADLKTEFDPELPNVSCLPGELNQVLLNLIVNAAHAIQGAMGENGMKKGMITIGTRRDGRWAEVFVRDTGSGIPESVRTRMFDPFFTTKEVGKGTGQGLAIARSVIVDKHGGTIDCETELGKGTTFLVRLPIDGQEQLEGAEHASIGG